jgi:hypothetical protein
MAVILSRRGILMYGELLVDKRFFGLLLRLDEDLATQARAAGCVVCGRRVHTGNFRRQARGVPRGLEAHYEWRFSFCCADRECRKRLTPRSMRFLGRKIYLGAVVVLGRGAALRGDAGAGGAADRDTGGEPADGRSLVAMVDGGVSTDSVLG